jgi:hypothetical protein
LAKERRGQSIRSRQTFQVNPTSQTIDLFNEGTQGELRMAELIVNISSHCVSEYTRSGNHWTGDAEHGEHIKPPQ